MPITQDRLTRLRGFGLSEYAARAYLALLDLGVAEARDVSTLSKVPQAKIYHVLEQLHEKGLAVILPEFPKKYAPVPFVEYVDRIHESHKRAADDIARDREILSDLFRVVGDTEVGNRGFFTVIRGRRNVVSKIQEMLGAAKHDVLMLGTPGLALRYSHFLPDLRAAKKRGARLRFLLPVTSENQEALLPLEEVADVRGRESADATHAGRVALLLVDNALGFLINFLPDDDNLYAGKDIGVATDQEAMVHALQSLVDPRWDEAPSAASVREHLASGRAPEFTHVLAGEDGVRSGVEAALARGVRELRAHAPLADEGPTASGDELTTRLAKAEAMFRGIIHAADTKATTRYDAFAKAGRELRHHAATSGPIFWILDEREAFVLVSGPPAGSNVVIHTSNASVIASLARQFEDSWATAITLDSRRKELERFPHIQPRDLGIGRLFEEMSDAVLVADAASKVVMWNAAAAAFFGRPVEDGVGTPLSSFVPDADAHVERALAGERVDATQLEANRGHEIQMVEARVLPLETAEATYAAILLRPVAAGVEVDVRESKPVVASKERR